MIPIVFHMSDEQAHRLAQRAHDAGYGTVEDYLQVLVEADLNEQSDAIQASIRRGFEDVISGRTLSETDFWQQLTTDDD